MLPRDVRDAQEWYLFCNFERSTCIPERDCPTAFEIFTSYLPRNRQLYRCFVAIGAAISGLPCLSIVIKCCMILTFDIHNFIIRRK